MRALIYLTVLILATGCSVPSAAPEADPTLVIALDQTQVQDSALFQQFGKKNGIKMKIVVISSDSLLRLFKKDPYNTGIDVVITHQLYDLRKLEHGRVFESLRSADFPNYIEEDKTETYLTLGYDPFVCIQHDRSKIKVRVYDDLAKIIYMDHLSPKSKAHFYAPFEQRMNRAKTFQRIEKIAQLAVPFNRNAADSAQAILTTYSSFRNRDPKDSTWQKSHTISYPNASTSGVFNDQMTIGIIKQSSNYTQAVAFVQWLMEGKVNRKFNGFRNYQPLRAKRSYKLFDADTKKLMQYHTMIDRMLIQLKE